MKTLFLPLSLFCIFLMMGCEQKTGLATTHFAPESLKQQSNAFRQRVIQVTDRVYD